MTFFPAVSRRVSGRLSFVAVAALSVLLAAEPVVAQSAALIPVDAPQQAVAGPQTLHIVILEGEDAINNIRDRTAREPIVQIEDENHKPVAGALVLFSLNGGSSGAGGTFGSTLSSLSVTTGADGRAVAHGLQANQVAGKFTINVQATLGSLAAEAVINQTNANSPSSQSDQQSSGGTSRIRKLSTKRNWLIASGVVAVAAVVIILGTRSTGTTITAGTGSVGH